MASQLTFFRKNWADFEKSYVTLTASEGQSVVYNLTDRSNRTNWGTEGTLDSNNTNIVVEFGDLATIDSILLLKHNLKNYKIEFWNDTTSLWNDFATPIHPTNCTDGSSFHSFPSFQTSKLRLTIYGTQVADDDKFIYQFIATSTIGKLTGWPIIKKPTLSRNIVEQAVLSGKVRIFQNVGRYSTSLEVANWRNSDDLAVIEALYDSSEGFLFWPCGGDEAQFSSRRQGYRMEDIFLCRCNNEWSPEFVQGLYKTGLKVQINLVEVTT